MSHMDLFNSRPYRRYRYTKYMFLHPCMNHKYPSLNSFRRSLRFRFFQFRCTNRIYHCPNTRNTFPFPRMVYSLCLQVWYREPVVVPLHLQAVEPVVEEAALAQHLVRSHRLRSPLPERRLSRRGAEVICLHPQVPFHVPVFSFPVRQWS